MIKSKIFSLSGVQPLKLLARLDNLPVLLIIQRSFSIALPIIMVGAFGLTIRHFPFSFVPNALRTVFGPNWSVHFDNLIAGTFGIVSLAMLCTVSGVLTMAFNQKRKGLFISPVMAIVVALSCFMIMAAPQTHDSWLILFSMKHGLLPAIILSMTSSSLFLYLAQFRRMQWPLGAAGHDPVVRDVLTVLPAGAATILCFFLLRIILLSLGFSNIHDSIRNLLFIPFEGAGNTLPFALAYSGLSQIFWFFGAHGPNLLFPVEENILSPALLANSAAISQSLNPDFIFTKPFFDAFTRMGGSGCTLCLIIAILLKSRDMGARKLCIFALLPALCNVNEPLLFGIPIVLNPSYIIPFLAVPMVQTLTAYLATAADWIPITTTDSTWTTPVFLSGYIDTGSFAGAVMQAVNLSIGTLLYIPFVKLSDRLREHQGERILKALMKAAVSSEINSRGIKLLELPGENGRFAKSLADDLESALTKEDQIFLAYQPKISTSKNFVHGVEALLRWHHPVYGMISPPITVALAEDLGIIDRLGLLVLSKACLQRAAWDEMVDDSLCMSVNVAPRQLSNPLFVENVMDTIQKSGLVPSMVELEITESTVVESDETTMKALQNLQKEGVRIAIDDFGMGHASLRYLRSFPVSTIKIDRSLTIGNAERVNDRIIRSVIELSESLNIETIIEGVETTEQLKRFSDLGCDQFQGYYFSRPLPAEECLAYILQVKNTKDMH